MNLATSQLKLGSRIRKQSSQAGINYRKTILQLEILEIILKNTEKSPIKLLGVNSANNNLPKPIVSNNKVPENNYNCYS